MSLKIEEVRIDSISNHNKNPKQHPEKQLRLLEESIKRFGWTNPVILSKDGVILAGHARVKAAISAGNDTVPCIRTKLTGAEADAYLIADNRLSDLAPYDRDILAELLGELPDDLAELTGFDSSDIDALLKGEDISEIDKFIGGDAGEKEEVDAEPQIDRAAELNEKWQVKTGDLWQCGEHRLICGDCTDPAVVERVMGVETDMGIMVTDPPYGVNYDPEWRLRSGLNKENQTRAEGIVQNDNRADWKDAWDLFTGDVAYVWHAGVGSPVVANSLICSGFDLRALVCWVKPSLVISRGHYHHQHEPCWYAVRQGKTADWIGDRKQSIVWDIPNMHRTQGSVDDGKTCHSTQKPVGCMSRPLQNHGHKYVYDPFLGSGTTLIACENTGRKCRGIEISPDYCAVILQRFKDATGKEPVRVE